MLSLKGTRHPGVIYLGHYLTRSSHPLRDEPFDFTLFVLLGVPIRMGYPYVQVLLVLELLVLNNYLTMLVATFLKKVAGKIIGVSINIILKFTLRLE